MTEPEYATFRDLVNAVQKVDTNLHEHKVEVEKRLSRIEKGLLLVAGLAVFHPHISRVPLLDGAAVALHHITSLV